jgi:hypothetical protein
VADSVVTLGLDLSAFDAVLREGMDGLSKGAQRALAGAKKAAAEATREAASALKAQIRLQDQAARDAAAAAREQAAAERQLAAEAQRRVQVQASAAKNLARLAAETNEVDRLTFAYEEQIAEIKRLVEVTGDHAAGEKAAAAAAAKHAVALDRLAREADDAGDQLRQAERAAKDAARASADAAKTQAEGLKGLGELVGLPVDRIEHLGKAMGLVAGPMAAVAGGAALATAALAGTAAAVFGLTNAAIALEDEIGPLRRDGLLPPLDPAFTQNLTDADLAMRGAAIRAKDLVVQVGAALAPAVEYGAVAFAGLVDSVRQSGVTLAGLGQVIRGGLVVALQSMVDFALRIPTLYAKMAGLVGQALEALGFESLGGKIQQVTADAKAFKNSLGETIAGGAVDLYAEGLTLMGRDADVAGASLRELGKAAKNLDAGPVRESTEAVKAHKKATEDAATAAREWAMFEGTINAQAEALQALIPELEAVIALLEQTAAAAQAQALAELQASAEAFGDEMRSIVTDPLRKAYDSIKAIGGTLQEAVGIDLSAFTSIEGAASELIRISTEAAQGQIDAQQAVTDARLAGAAAVKSAEQDLARAVATGDDGAIASARQALASAEASAKEGIAAAKADLEAASPAAFIKGLMDGAVQMVDAIVEALPAVVGGLVDGAPKLIDGIISAIPQLVIAIAKAAPQIAIDLATAFAIELPIQLLANLPQIAKSLAVGIGEGFVKAGARIKRVVGDIFREIATGGRADTRTFGDTPGPTRVGPGGARVSAGDYVVAARSPEGLAAQMGGQPAPQAVVVTLDVRDGPVSLGLSRAVARDLSRRGAGRDSSGRRSPYGGGGW